ncbi:TPM domain-containing protein [Candidatus Berkiella cookevillensis]|uniref:TPM domain-containing protein n=1 Tax=Candidatus Berkiella cookevillensis TaxID=437022 RepID=A0A0Q9YSW2_9GAMM|nr:TPM domain-containing protein [Candidatus Berkiella cookevillensis]MCS5707662.1 TPM domain-containing protein [Candidatus Berkiella cookevillensis]
MEVCRFYNALAVKKQNFLLCILSLLFSSIIFAQAQTTTAPAPYISDYAKVIDAYVFKQYNELLGQIELNNKLRIEAVIMPDFKNDPPEKVVNYFIEQLSNRQPAPQYSALFIVSLKENYASIHPSTNMEAFYPPAVQDEIIGKVKKEMQGKDYQRVLKEGIGGIVYYFEKNSKNITPKRTLKDLIMDNLILLGLAALFAVVLAVSRRKPQA